MLKLARCDVATGKMEASGGPIFGPVHLGDDGKTLYGIDISKKIAIFDAESLMETGKIAVGDDIMTHGKFPPREVSCHPTTPARKRRSPMGVLGSRRRSCSSSRRL